MRVSSRVRDSRAAPDPTQIQARRAPAEIQAHRS